MCMYMFMYVATPIQKYGATMIILFILYSYLLLVLYILLVYYYYDIVHTSYYILYPTAL